MTRTRGVAGWIVAGLLLSSILMPTPSAQPARGEIARCVVATSTATTIQAVGGDCAAKPGQTLWVTDVLFSTNAAGIAADSYNTLKYGTGTTCGTGTTIFWLAMTPAAVQSNVAHHLTTPLRLPAGVDVCWINSSAGSKALVIAGFYTP